MGYTRRFKLAASTLFHLQRKRDAIEENIEICLNNRRKYACQVENTSAAKELFDTLWWENFHTFKDENDCSEHAIVDLYHARQKREELWYAAMTESNTNEDTLMKLETQLVPIIKGLNVKSEWITKENIMKELRVCNKVDLNSVYLGTDSSINFTMRNIVMRPSQNNYAHIANKAPVQLPLPDLRIKITLPSTIEVAQENPDNGLNYYASGSCHPHVLSGNSPCWGEFSGGIAVTLDALDFSSVVLILQQFLEQANADDIAGATWPAWFGLLFNGLTVLTEDNCRLIKNDEDHQISISDEGFVLEPLREELVELRNRQAQETREREEEEARYREEDDVCEE